MSDFIDIDQENPDLNYAETTCFQEKIISDEIKSLKNNLCQSLFEYNYDLKPNKFSLACEQSIKKFSAFRTRFCCTDKLKQITDQNDSKKEKFLFIDSEKSNNNKMTINDYLANDRLKTLESFKGNLIRITLLKENTNHYYLILSYHAAILDYTSAKIVVNYINETYIKLINEDKIVNTDDLSDFKDVYKSLEIRKAKNNEYWKHEINKLDEQIDLNLLKPSDDLKSEHKSQALILSENIFEKVKKFNNLFQLESEFIFQFIFHKIVYIYTNTSNTIIGTTVDSRNLSIKNIEKTVGCFLNIVPVIVNHENTEISIVDKIREIKEGLNEKDLHSNYETNSEIENLFCTLFTYENYEKNSENLGFKYLESYQRYERNNNLIIKENETLKNITLNFVTLSENSFVVKNILSLFGHLLDQILDNPNKKLSDLNYLIPSQEIKVLKEWNDTDMD